MKKILISLVLLVPFLTGCADIDTRVTINDDKSASVVTSLTYRGDLSDLSDNTAQRITDNYSSFLDALYTNENAFGAKLSTITASKSVKNVEYEDLDLSSLGFVTNHPNGKFIEVKKNLLVTSYNIDLTYDLQAKKEQFEKSTPVAGKKQVAEPISPGLRPEYYYKYGDMSELEPPEAGDEEDFVENLDPDTKDFIEQSVVDDTAKPADNIDEDLDMSFSIKLPALASFNNADSSDGSVYTWTIKQDAPVDIKLQYVRYNGFAIGFIVLACFGLLVLLVKKIIQHDSQKRMDNIDNIV